MVVQRGIVEKNSHDGDGDQSVICKIDIHLIADLAAAWQWRWIFRCRAVVKKRGGIFLVHIGVRSDIALFPALNKGRQSCRHYFTGSRNMQKKAPLAGLPAGAAIGG